MSMYQICMLLLKVEGNVYFNKTKYTLTHLNAFTITHTNSFTSECYHNECVLIEIVFYKKNIISVFSGFNISFFSASLFDV